MNDVGAMVTDEDFKALERVRLRSLVERNIELARSLHSPDFHLVTPRGTTHSRESYLQAVAGGAIVYLKWEAADIRVRRFDHIAVLRYQAVVEMPGPSGEHLAFDTWHTDTYELHDGLWQVVWSQATRIQ